MNLYSFWYNVSIMKIHHFISKDFDLEKPKIIIADFALVRQIRDVLHLEPGEEIILGNGTGTQANALIVEMKKKTLEAEIIKKQTNITDSQINIKLYCAILKRDNFEWVAQKATEIGVGEIIPVVTKRTIKTNLNLERLEKIINEAAEQSGRGTLPLVQKPIDFEDALEEAKQNKINVFFDAGGDGFEKVKTKVSNKESIGLFIGPEGGWEEDEVDLIKKKKIKIVSLGNLTLRAETAAIVATYIASKIEAA